MDLNEYQQRAGDTGVYQGRGSGSIEALAYTALGCAGEAGEVANVVKKRLKIGEQLDADSKEKLLEELGDVMWYVAMAASEAHLSLELVAQWNLSKLQHRYGGPHEQGPTTVVGRGHVRGRADGDEDPKGDAAMGDA